MGLEAIAMTTCRCCQQTFKTDAEYTDHFQSSATTLPILQLVREFYLVPKNEFSPGHTEMNMENGKLTLAYIAFVKR